MRWIPVSWDFYKKIFKIKEDAKNSEQEKEKPVYWYPLDKPFKEMSRKERRKYVRWLEKNGCFDSEVAAYYQKEMFE